MSHLGLKLEVANMANSELETTRAPREELLGHPNLSLGRVRMRCEYIIHKPGALGMSISLPYL